MCPAHRSICLFLHVSPDATGQLNSGDAPDKIFGQPNLHFDQLGEARKPGMSYTI